MYRSYWEVWPNYFWRKYAALRASPVLVFADIFLRPGMFWLIYTQLTTPRQGYIYQVAPAFVLYCAASDVVPGHFLHECVDIIAYQIKFMRAIFGGGM